jgi:hypothetical protein
LIDFGGISAKSILDFRIFPKTGEANGHPLVRFPSFWDIQRNMKRNRLFICIALVIFLLAASIYIACSQDFYRADGSDFFSLWLAPHLLLQGQDPYRSDVWVPAHDTFGARWISDPTFLYPLPLAVLLLPFGIFPLDVAAVLWVFLSLAAIMLVARKLIASWLPGKLLPYLLPALAGILLFRPTFLTLLVGQMEILLLLCLAGAAWLWEGGEWLKGGLLVSVVVLKPQIGLPLLALAGLWLLVHRRWTGLAGMGLAALGLFALGAVFDIGWVGRWLSIGQGKVSGVFGYSPTVWGVAATVCRHQYPCTSLLGGVLSIVVVAGGLWILLPRKELHPMNAIGVIIPVALLTTPYLWAYTQVLLIIPILLVMGRMYHRKLPYLLVATFPLTMAVLAFILLFVAVGLGTDVWSAAVPLASLILLGFLT